MSVLCCRIPDFLLNLACHSQDAAPEELQRRPLALLAGSVGAGEHVCAVSPAARQSGVRIDMSPRQAQMRCPDIEFRPLNSEVSRQEQGAFLSTLAEWQLPVEAQSWGLAYIDLHGVAAYAQEVQPLAADLGRRVRQQMSRRLQPALGWDSGKFTARAAAAYTMPGRMRLVGKTDEVRFLSPLSVTLLPLPSPALQQLHWLGIRTLGQFAALPPAGVWQRFGPQGRLAQSWARGHDDRPVQRSVQEPAPALDIDLDPPSALLPPVVEAAMHALDPHLQALYERMEGCRRLHLDLRFIDGNLRRDEITFIDPCSRAQEPSGRGWARLRDALTHRLQTPAWPAELERMSIAILETAELPAQQLSLFPQELEPSAPLQTLVQKLASRYGSPFFKGEIPQARHPLAERRIHFQALA